MGGSALPRVSKEKRDKRELARELGLMGKSQEGGVGVM
jgi:hypothetical protein